MNELLNDFSNTHFIGELSLGVVCFRLLLAIVFGGLVGFERERKHKPAGFRTYILVCFGSAVVSMIQDQLRVSLIDFNAHFPELAALFKSDLGRLGAQVISGIGFLGAGSIIKERGESIAGMTTAAGIWATGCVGLGIGWGFYNIAVVAIAFMLIIMIFLKRVESQLIKRNFVGVFQVTYEEEELNVTETIEICSAIFRRKSMSITKVEKDVENHTLTFTIATADVLSIGSVVSLLSAKEGIAAVSQIQ